MQDLRAAYSPNDNRERPRDVKSYDDGCRIRELSYQDGNAVALPLPHTDMCVGDILEMFDVSFHLEKTLVPRHTAIITSIESHRLHAVG